MSESDKSRRQIAIFLLLLFGFSAIYYSLILIAHKLRAGNGLYVTGMMWCPALAAVATLKLHGRKLSELGWKWPATRYLQQIRREPLFAWLAYLLWSFFLCIILAHFAFEYDLLPHILDPSATQSRPLIDYLYYEVITFTTVGYGDIIPATVPAKILAMCTALFGAAHGVTFVAIVFQALTHPPSKGEE
jgi:hypothetical protein